MSTTVNDAITVQIPNILYMLFCHCSNEDSVPPKKQKTEEQMINRGKKNASAYNYMAEKTHSIFLGARESWIRSKCLY